VTDLVLRYNTHILFFFLWTCSIISFFFATVLNRVIWNASWLTLCHILRKFIIALRNGLRSQMGRCDTRYLLKLSSDLWLPLCFPCRRSVHLNGSLSECAGKGIISAFCCRRHRPFYSLISLRKCVFRIIALRAPICHQFTTLFFLFLLLFLSPSLSHFLRTFDSELQTLIWL
jgi:hypothetical protein